MFLQKKNVPTESTGCTTPISIRRLSLGSTLIIFIPKDFNVKQLRQSMIGIARLWILHSSLECFLSTWY